MDHETSILCFNQYWHWIKELPGTDMMLISVASALGNAVLPRYPEPTYKIFQKENGLTRYNTQNAIEN